VTSAHATTIRTRELSGGGRLVVSERFRQGGESVVYRLSEPRGYVLKEYTEAVLAERGADVDAKLKAMLARPPRDPTLHARGHVSIAWPEQLALDDHGATCGFLMREIDTAHAVELQRVQTPSDRMRRTEQAKKAVPALFSGFTWKHLLQVATNLTSAIDGIHDRGYVVGDLNTANVLVNDHTLITVIDCDSFQVSAPDGATFVCPVQMPDEMAPELMGRDLRVTIRECSSDDYLLAKHVYRLLMEGWSPYSGRWVGEGRELTEEAKVRQGAFHYSDARIQPGPGVPPFHLLPSDIQALCVRAFRDGADDPTKRPSAREWQESLASMRDTLTECAIHKHRHAYPGHLGACPWCELDRTKAAAREERERERKRRRGEAAAGVTRLGGGLPPTPPRRPEPPLQPAPPKQKPPTNAAKGTAGSPQNKKPATSAPAQPRPATWAGRLWFVPAVVPVVGPPVSWTYAAAKARSATYLAWAVCYWAVFAVGVIGGALISSKAQRESSQLGTQEVLVGVLWLVSIVHTFAQAGGVRTAIARREAAKAAARP
jgi:DNA-binding helix-hairpin-helix protein with protein kinase domain